ncbi:hypothetical protein KIN20_034741 [Parelaphostrongylus tenuis]|uniref:Uncharacterized protein n=1 Tax=Parelaphostrongylus tenuis TaxID=148309 RepID=A0AAD5RAW1_PARTN|nr:hypothetical protein KIN20_034741 [Parelaphostrongylus tenuis]
MKNFASHVEDKKFRDLLTKHSELEKRMFHIDEEAKQVKLAMELQRSMTDCYSNSASDFPLQTSIKLRT